MRGGSTDRGMTLLCPVADKIVDMYGGMTLPATGNPFADLGITFDFSPPAQQDTALRFSTAFLADIPASTHWHMRGISQAFSHKRIYLVSEAYAITYAYPRKKAIFKIKDIAHVMKNYDYLSNGMDMIEILGGLRMKDPFKMATPDYIYIPSWPGGIKEINGESSLFFDLKSQLNLDAIADPSGILQLTSVLAKVIHSHPEAMMLWLLQYYYIYPNIFIIDPARADKGIIQVQQTELSEYVPNIITISVKDNKITIACKDGHAFGLRLYATGKQTHTLGEVSVDLVLRKSPMPAKKYIV